MPRRRAALSGLLRLAHPRDLRQPTVAGRARNRLEQPRAAIVPQYAPDDVQEDPVNPAGGRPDRRRHDDEAIAGRPGVVVRRRGGVARVG
ncbi:hypothetical protein G6F22_017400 [Rhizopus arrhizus]|nr:hypothetical protein G6F24_017532 [Rhizopus arrhizus]KAG0769191.1 hypothetical protein G6F22_017400 [Rhizopus arrhizus]KAG0920476.1 hypothetical protein G6F32_015585 [Rhizopus arrhizus]